MEIFVAILGSGALSALISGVFALVRDRKAKKDGVRNGIRQILYDLIKTKGRDYIADGEISTEDLEDLIDAHRIYHDELQGNGFLDRIMDDVRKLRITK